MSFFRGLPPLGATSPSLLDVVERITNLNRGLAQFWGDSAGWAPMAAAGLLSRSRLDWQVSLSACLGIWQTPRSPGLADGALILSWANLGALVEGSLKLLLSVYYETYASDLDALRRKGKLLDPDGLSLEPLKVFIQKKNLLAPKELELIETVQHRRNAIHAFKDRDIGTSEEFERAVKGYLDLLRSINKRLPYPDDVYVPQE